MITPVNQPPSLSYDICFTSNESSYETGYYGLFGICDNTYSYSAYNISIHWVNTYSSFRISAFDGDNYMTTSNTKLQQNFFSINMDFGTNKQVQLFKNGILVGSSSEKIGNISRVDVSKLGLQVLFFNSGYYNNFNCQVSLHAIRFYNKIRTEDEIMHNYLVDKERFGA